VVAREQAGTDRKAAIAEGRAGGPGCPSVVVYAAVVAAR
jgi:hypothetical protein